MDAHVCPGAIVIEGRIWQMLAAALLNQSVSRQQAVSSSGCSGHGFQPSSSAIEHQLDAINCFLQQRHCAHTEMPQLTLRLRGGLKDGRAFARQSKALIRQSKLLHRCAAQSSDRTRH
jgi:hypothetical protein